MRKLSKKSKAIVAIAAVIGLASSGAAYSYWTQSGAGTGTAATGTTTPITVNQVSTPSAMYPGSTAQALSGNFTNPNPGAVQISSVTAAVSSITNGFADNTKPACLPGDYAISGTSGGTTVPAGTAVGTWAGLSIQLTNTAANQDNCKGATANITYTANP